MGNITAIPNGMSLPVDSLPFTMTYSGSIVATITVHYAGITYINTFTNNGTQITGSSGYIAQVPVIAYLQAENNDQLISENGNLLIGEAA